MNNVPVRAILEWENIGFKGLKKEFKMGLYQYEHEFKAKEQERIRYVAKLMGQIWHTDLHEIEDLVIRKANGEEEHRKQYLVAFLDDRSRFIIMLQ